MTRWWIMRSRDREAHPRYRTLHAGCLAARLADALLRRPCYRLSRRPHVRRAFEFQVPGCTAFPRCALLGNAQKDRTGGPTHARHRGERPGVGVETLIKEQSKDAVSVL